MPPSRRRAGAPAGWERSLRQGQGPHDADDTQDAHDGPEDDDGKGQGLSKRDTRAYQSAMEAVFAIPIAMGIGWWADSKLGTSPWLLILGLVLGFTTFVRRLVRMRGLVEEASREHGDDEPEQ